MSERPRSASDTTGPTDAAVHPAAPETDVSPGLYEHYKGNRYEVLELARHSETEEWFVVYRALYGDHGVWIRPLGMFAETVDGARVPRFRRVETP
ncbi:Protein of unknown function [Agromyces sp. CF514]|uniref:DUF1653 domain-containing protein n=1 Tax=Agromyces sp. CF514 TaxID=1881031 RepID=UPI0008E8FF64|nr:DUF1653 domain-containing protein [Agromyces sp. CF514]SFR74959.1 Protein of unknown function [Agromyces sp. CF514]